MAEPDLNEDLRSLRELLIYGLKSLSAYSDHIAMFDELRTDLCAFVQEALAYTVQPELDADRLITLVMTCGKIGVDVMAALDHQHTSRYGHPEPTQVELGVVDTTGMVGWPETQHIGERPRGDARSLAPSLPRPWNVRRQRLWKKAQSPSVLPTRRF